MDIIIEILDEVINYSIFFYKDEIIEIKHIDKYIEYLYKNINYDFCDSYFEKFFSINNIDDVINIKDYLFRLAKGFQITNSIMISAIIYLERLDVNINIYNIHILLLISLLLSSKFLEDFNYKNKYWSKYGYINITTLNRLEKLYLKKIKNNLFIHTNQFYNKYKIIFQ